MRIPQKRTHLEPIAKKAIDNCKKSGAELIMCVDGFQTAPEALILRDMLWYARDKGVVVKLVPNK